MCWAISATEALGERATAAVVVVVDVDVVGVDVPVVVVLGVEMAAAVACWRFGAILSVLYIIWLREGY